MVEDVVIEMMGDEPVLWQCLHGGPLTAEIIDTPRPNKEMDWERTKARNLPLVKKLTELYGACAVIARDGRSIVGMLRFYPK